MDSGDGLPLGAVRTKRSRTFTPESLPAALRANHSTRQGVWGLIVVESGAVLYTRHGSEGHILRADTNAAQRARHVIHPEELHSVEFVEPGAFFVQFYEVTGDTSA